MDFENLNADVNRILSKHFTSGRSGRSIKHVVIHYNAGDLTVEGCYSVWQTREASAHYQVESSGRIGQLVWDKDTAWHASNWNENCQSIGIEHANKSGGTVTEACLDAGAHLTAAICKYYGLGRPEWGVNVFPHKHFSATSCPGQLYGSQKDAYIQRAQAWYDAMASGTSAPSTDTGSTTTTTTTVSGTAAELAQRVINGEFGNGDARKAALGDRYDEVQAEVNRILGGGSTATATATKSVAELAQEVIDGDWSNGDDRKQRLTAAGYDYSAVQAKVNELLGSSSTVDIDALARAVIRGDYGNGEERKAKLGSNYAAVQARVNELLG